ncbi:MAG: benzoate/H(+) symporter BenE family transporter [Cardiobacteriaceae bacterium]|nr:benzoate/H(+) symporter BenE family transporter [Cardiobacteriaceae bacterium]
MRHFHNCRFPHVFSSLLAAREPFFPDFDGFPCVLVGFASSVALVIQAAGAAGASPAQTAGWIAALCVGSAVSGILLSARFRVPVITAWSTPGAALLIAALPGFSLAEAVGAFVVCGALLWLSGATGVFARLMEKIPPAVSAGMLAGILLRFGLGVFAEPLAFNGLPLLMFALWLVVRRVAARYAVLAALLGGLSWVLAQGALLPPGEAAVWAWPAPVWPAFSLSALVGVALPLYVVTMTSQNLPGITVMRAAGFPPPVSAALSATGLATLVLAPFGAFAVNLAAITAAMAMGEDVHPERDKRYIAGIWTGIFYVLTALCAGVVVVWFMRLPPLFVLTLAGLALIPVISASLHLALDDGESREAAMLAFLVAASGVNLWGIGAAFWAIVVGVAVYALRKQ